MNEPISAIRTRSRGGPGGDTSGTAAVEFALLLPALIFMLVGILEFVNVAVDYQRAAEATRRGARSAAMGALIPGAGAIEGGGTVTCSGVPPSCNEDTIANPAAFTALVADMQLILPDVTGNNVQVAYTDFAVGGAGIPGTVTPMVTVSLVNYQHPFLIMSGFPGMPAYLTFPAFATSRLAATTPVP